MLAASQNSFGAFNQTAWAYDELLWKISNDAYASGAAILDAEGKALNSAQDIFNYMSSGTQAFNDTVKQIANITGLSVEQVMQQINGMIGTTANNAAALINYLGASSLGVDSGFNRAPAAVPVFSDSLFAGVNGGSNVGYGYGSAPSSGGGGSSSSDNESQKAEQEAAERLRKIEEAIEKARDNATKALKKQLGIYKDMVDARKDLLDTMADEREYQQETEASQNLIADIQNEISELMFDNSDEAQARILALQEELVSAQQDLDNLQFEHGTEVQKDALDAEYSRLEAAINGMIDAVENINATSLSDFKTKLAAVLSYAPAPPAFHDGLEKGVVGGATKTGEQFAKLMKGEVVVNPSQMNKFMGSVMPESMRNAAQVSSNVEGGLSVGNLMNIVVNGSLDKTTIPEIRSIAEKVMGEINKTMMSRGVTRRTELFSQ